MSPSDVATTSALDQHLDQLLVAVDGLRADVPRLERWGEHLARVLLAGGRLLAGGNGGSAAQAQHLTAELVGRYHAERRPLSAIALHADTSAYTAIVNDYGADEVLARQVVAHGRPGDVLVLLSTSGRSPNVLAAARTAVERDLTTWALTGPAPNPLVDLCAESVSVDAATPTVQEAHQAAIHLVCEALDAAVRRQEAAPGRVIDLSERLP
jgi:D-sedoheptulose 7-phosphate isomerase